MKKFIWATASLLFHASASPSLQQTATNNITFATAAKAVHAITPALYVGASPAVRTLGVDKKVLSNKLARIAVNDAAIGADAGKVLQPFAPSKIKLDGSDADHPLNDATQVIGQLAILDDRFPVFATAKYDDTGKPPTVGGLFLVDDDVAGASITKADAINDHEGNPIKAVPAALAAGKRFVFAAVSKGDSQFDDPVEDKRGIAVFEYAVPDVSAASGDGAAPTTTDKKLKQINGPNYADATAKALTIDLSAKVSPVVAFGDGTANGIDHALVGRTASAAWDEGLQRLYVGFNATRCDDPTKPGGVLGLCMAYPTYAADATTLQKFDVVPVVDSPGRGHLYSPPAAGIFEKSNPDFAIADFAHDLIGGLPPAPLAPANFVAGFVAPWAASAFSVTLSDLQICSKVLEEAVKYCRTHPAGGAGNHATDLLTYLRGNAPGDANIGFAPRVNNYFLSDWNPAAVGAHTLTIFGKNFDTINNAGADTHILLLSAIRARFVQLLANAKIVNKAYAMGNFANSVFTNSLDFIIGYYADGNTFRLDENTGVVQARNDGNDDLAVSIPRLAVMNTSSGRPYLIVHSIMSTSPVSVGGSLYTEADNWIYALPLIPNALNGAEYLKGTIAAVVNDKVGKIAFDPAMGVDPGTYQVPQDFAAMPKRFQRAVRVGGGNPVPASWVQDMFVAGDSVYITLAGVQAGQQGVFKSTAIFDGDGCIIDWTPATRVMGQVTQTFAGMVDPKSANFYSLTQTPTGQPGATGASTAQVTQWGKGSPAMHGGNPDYSLDAVLSKAFPKNKGGVHGAISFDDMTYGFPKKQLSMLMAYGFDSVALVQTGRRKGRAFTPFNKHAVADDAAHDIKQNVFLFNDPNVAAIGPVTCGAVVHCPPDPAQAGWTRFYVGGYRGLVMQEIAYANPAAFMAAFPPAGFVGHAVPGVLPGDGVTAVGESVTRDPVTGLINHWYLHVLTHRGVIVNEIPVAPGAFVALNVLGPLGGANAIDGCVLANGTIVATRTGLNFVPSAGAGQVALAMAQNVTPLQIQVVAARDRDGLFALPATVYVLGMGPRMADDVADAAAVGNDLVPQLWRVALWADAAGAVAANTSKTIDVYKNHPTLKGQPRPYAQYDNLRLNFTVDGSMWFDALSRDGMNADFLRVTELTKPQDQLDGFVALQTSLVDKLDLDSAGNFRIGIPLREAATGAWLVPGDWGLRVNE